ncbi:MAG TPA: carboxypeptidase regulatory-like domain-containing protein [Bacteroidales bacterium]|nr:carboxypeptidase regulatory-like domain-containing protein [Bacteroidales bacterium]
MIRKLLFILMALITSAGVYAQSAGTLSGRVTDAATGEPIPFANVTIEENGNIVTGGMTDFDGNFSIKPIPAGRFTVSASYIGYATLQYTNVQIIAGKIVYQNFDLNPAAEILGEVEIKEYKVPLISKDQTQSGGTVTSEDIAKMPGRSAAAVATTVGGVYTEDGEVGSIRGARSEGTVYYVDGVKVRGSSAVPKSAIEQVTVITGGLPAQYGDVTGGVISATTKGPSSNFYGGGEVVTSQYLDPYGYNLAAIMVSGPIWSVTEKGESNRKRTVAGFLLAAEGRLVKDGGPSAVGEWRANADVLEEIRTNPLRLIESQSGNIIYQNSDYLHADAFQNYKSRANAGGKGANVAAKLDISPIRDLNFTVGGTFDIGAGRLYSYGNQLFNSHNNGNYISSAWNTYARITQKFRTEDTAVIKNPYYTIQFDYSRSASNNFNSKFKDNYFEYGHIGNFTTVPEKYYIWGIDSVTGLEGNLFETYFYRITDFTTNEQNADLARYTEQYFDYFSDYYYKDVDHLLSYGGLMNGNGAPAIYGMYSSPGNPYASFAKSEGQQFRVSASGTADIKSHEFSLGFEFEQRKDSYYAVAPFGLWTLARRLTNMHIMEKDISKPIIYYDDQGNFLDTIDYPRLYNAQGQSRFDKYFRESLGMEINDLTWIDVDSYDPSTFDISWFSADELFNQGSPVVAYYGYDYQGNKLHSKPTFDDFFNQTDSKGYKTRPIAPFEPSYVAGYIQDKFAFKDLIFNLGVRVDRYDANQMVLKDQYLLHEAYKLGDTDQLGLLANTTHPENIPDEATVYVNDLSNPTAINGYRVGNVWYNANGVEIENPNVIASPNGIAPYLINPKEELNTKAFEDYKPQIVVMPRISFSFPISDEALFFAHYDILSKRPSYSNRLNPIEYLYIRQMNDGLLNNPNLKTEKTIDYELGFQQKLGNTSALKLSAFYREMRDMQQAIAVYGAYPATYYTYGNIDFGTVKGFGVSYDMRRTGNVTLRASYTLQFANGTGSSYSSGAAIVMSDKPNLRTTLPLDFDQRHNLAITVDYRYGGKVSGLPYNGPKIAGKSILANTGVNFIINSGSGSPYTKRNRPNNGTVVGTLNGSRKPWRTTINMRLDRDFRIKLSDKKEDGTKEKYSDLNVYLEISNLLNTKNVLGVYSYTGNPDDDGFLNYADYQTSINTQNDVEAFRNYYSMYINSPYNYSTPRTIRLGVQFGF